MLPPKETKISETLLTMKTVALIELDLEDHITNEYMPTREDVYSLEEESTTMKSST